MLALRLHVAWFLDLLQITSRGKYKGAISKTFLGVSYTAFGMWWHTVTHGRGSEGETGEWSG